MKFDIFLSICQTQVDGYLPSEKIMFDNFFRQVSLADQLGFNTAWIAETHLSCQVQKQNPRSVIPHFTGEIGLNTDILQMAHLVFARTKKINVGSAIRNIICNGGPLAHAEAIKTFLSLHQFQPWSDRLLELGFAAGRFPFSNEAYGFYPQSDLECLAWDIIKNKYFAQATEIFLRALRSEHFSSADISPQFLLRSDFRDEKLWQKILDQRSLKDINSQVELNCHWQFPKVGVIPFEAPLDKLKLTIGSHDPSVQNLANQFLPVGVFNLSITPESVIEETHSRMSEKFHPQGGKWRRELMPRTVLLFLDDSKGCSDLEKSKRAQGQARKAWENYWNAMEGTLDPQKVSQAVSNTIAGHPAEVAEKIKLKYHPDDRLMLWFDFNNHNSEMVESSMKSFIEKVAPQLI